VSRPETFVRFPSCVRSSDLWSEAARTDPNKGASAGIDAAHRANVNRALGCVPAASRTRWGPLLIQLAIRRQGRAEVNGSARFAADRLLEEAGFELFVHLGISAYPSWWSRARKPHGAPEGGSPWREASHSTKHSTDAADSPSAMPKIGITAPSESREDVALSAVSRDGGASQEKRAERRRI